MIIPDLLEKSINLVDIGAVGNPPPHWLPLKDKIHLFGFEPNKNECNKLNDSNCVYKKSEFLPYAVGEKDESRPFYITEYHECCSLLKPNLVWLNRFNYSSFFNVKQMIEVETVSLDSIKKFSNIYIDALKIDAQGNELPILKGATSLLKHVFLIEIESGLHKNYENETTFSELYPFLKNCGFMCMEMKTQPHQKRKNIGADWESAKGQAMACESIWVRDFLTYEKTLLNQINRDQFLSILSLCWLFGYSDYGVELLKIKPFNSLLEKEIQSLILEEKSWKLPQTGNSPSILTKIIGTLSHILPTPSRRNLYTHLPNIAEQPNLFKKIFSRGG